VWASPINAAEIYPMIGRRKFIAGIGGAAAWPLTARAQQGDVVRRIGWVDFAAKNDPGAIARDKAFRQEIEKLGWTVNRNLAIEYRWNVSEIESAKLAASELLRLMPDLFLCAGTPATAALKQATSTVPIVFTTVSEPVAQGLVQSLAHPGGNLTGFSFLEPTLGAKWLGLLKEIAPRISHVTLMYNPSSSPYSGLFFQSIESAAATFGVEAVMTPVHDLNEIEQLITILGQNPVNGLIVSAEGYNLVNRKPIIAFAARHRVPAVYGIADAAFDGGLIHYTVDFIYQFRSAAIYVDQIFRGRKPADLPVQQPTKFSFVVNARTARALGLTIPPNLLALADEVIE
jgi:putative ABC transport system substrate-binding protein